MSTLHRLRSYVRRVPVLHRVASALAALVAAARTYPDVRRRVADLEDHRVRSLELRTDELEHGRRELDGRVVAVERQMPQLLNAASSYAGATRRLTRMVEEANRRSEDTSRTVGALMQRIETIRRETMIEMRYGRSGGSTTAPVESRIVDSERVGVARSTGIRLNLGCGHLPMPDYVNVDMRELPGVEVIAPVDDLPFEKGEVAEIFSAHLVEHFPQEQFVREILPYWVSMLRPGGTLRAVLPDAGAMLAGFADGSVTYEDLREVTFGGQEYEGDFHFNMYTTDTLSEILADAGLRDVTVEAEGRRNGACLEMQLSGRLPE